jgi:hypothetical protein
VVQETHKEPKNIIPLQAILHQQGRRKHQMRKNRRKRRMPKKRLKILRRRLKWTSSLLE